MAFNNKMIKVSVDRPVITINEYGEKVITYQFVRYIQMALAQSTINTIQNNDMNILNVEYLGLTTDRYIQKGMRIDNKYIVSYVEVNRIYSIVHMVEIDNDGRLQSSIK